MPKPATSLEEALEIAQMLEVLTEAIISAPEHLSSLPFGGVHVSLKRIREILQNEVAGAEPLHDVKRRIKPFPTD